MTKIMEPMLRAIQLGEKGRCTAPPNPWVGCVIVNGGEIVGEGYHAKAGEPHAEVLALRQAKQRARGATAFVTLEPCSHFGRTPPCVQALIKAEVARVVIALKDPDPKVEGIPLLKKAGIDVTVGICEKLAEQSLKPYLHHRKTGLPYCVGKAAVSIDGRIAAQDHSSQWITSDKAREDVHALRAASQAILVGSTTALRDQPRLTVRTSPPPLRQPLRVVLDSRGKVPHTGPLFDTQLAPTLLITANPALKAPVETLTVSATEEGVDLAATLKELGARGILQVLIEGGGTLLSSFVRQNRLQRLELYIGPKILGDKGIPLFSGLEIATLSAAPTLSLLTTTRLEECTKLSYESL